MNAHEYLSQAYLLEQQVRCKMDQIESLNSLATCVTPRPTDQEPVSHSRNVCAMEETVLKIVEATRELDEQIDALVDKKIELSHTIAMVQDVEYRLVLERRYLTFSMWEEIAAELHYSVRTVQRLHVKALEEVQYILDTNM